MKTAIKEARTTLYYIRHPVQSETDIEAFLTEGLAQRLREAGVAAVLLVSSQPVGAAAYRRLVAWLVERGLALYSHYINGLSSDSMRSMHAAVRDIRAGLEAGSCLVISCGNSVAPTAVTCFYLDAGMGAGEAIEHAADVRAGAVDADDDLVFLHDFQQFTAARRASSREKTSRKKRLRKPEEIKAIPLEPAGGPAPGQGMILDAIPIEGGRRSPSGQSVQAAEDSPPPEAASVPADGEEAPAAPQKKGRKEKPEKPAGEEESVPAAVGEVHAGPFYVSLRFKLITIISIITVAALTGMIFLASYFFKQDNRVRVEENNLGMSEVVSLKAVSDFESFIKRARAAAPGIPARNARAGQASPLDDDPDVLSVSVILRAGAEGLKIDRYLFNQRLMAKYQVSDQALLTAILRNAGDLERAFLGETSVSNISPALGVPVMMLGMPHGRTGKNETASVLVTCVALESLQKAFQGRGGITTVFMVNDRADVIAHPDGKTVVAGGNYRELPIITMMMKSRLDNGQTRYKDQNGVPHIGSFKKIEIGGCGVIATVEEARAFQEVYNIQRRNIYITVIVLTVVIMIIFYFGNTITSPIIKLVGATKKIKEGVYSVDIRPTTRDEIGELTSSFIEMGRGLEEREKIKNAFGKFVNKEIAEAAMRDELVLGGERKEVAILFSDMRSFTSISEKLQPEEVVEFLNQYMTRMVACVNGTFGVVDKFIGDAIMAVWGTPVSRGNDTENCIDCSLRMRGELIEYNKGRGGPRNPRVMIGIGISTGPVLAGQIGSEDRMEYTVIGDTVNLASRIETLNKPFGTDILISEDSWKLVRDIYAAEKMQTIKVKGKVAPLQIYAVLGRLDDPDRPKSLQELRRRLGIKEQPFNRRWDDGGTEGEVKYEILEK